MIKLLHLNYLMVALAGILSTIGLDLAALLVATCSLFLTTYRSEWNNLFHMTWIPSVYLFSLTPASLLYAFGMSDGVGIYILVVTFTILVVEKTKGLILKLNPTRGKGYLWFYAIVWGAIFGLAVPMGSAAYFYLFPLLAILFALATNQTGKIGAVLLYISILALIVIYFIYHWSGFGRLVLAGWIIVPSLILLVRIGLKFNQFLYCFLVSVAGILASFLRLNNLTLDNLIRASLEDSAMNPYILSQDIFDNTFSTPYSIDFQGYLIQVAMFLIGAFPREFWPSKPNGFGFEYTLNHSDQFLIDAGNSVAALFIGENFYYLGIFGFLGCFVSVWLVLVLYKYIYNLDYSGIYSIGVAVWILTYVWGGIASFSQRFQLGAAAIAVFYIISKLPRLYRYIRAAH